MTMTQVVHPVLWQRLLDGWRTWASRNTFHADLGLSRAESSEGQELTRVVVAVIPEHLMDQWNKTAEAVAAAMMKEMGKTFLLWIGTGKLVRASKHHPGGTDRTLKEAHEWCTKHNRAILWVVPACTKSAKQTVRAQPHLTIPFRIYDDPGGDRTEPRSHLPESHVLKNVIAQATITRLKDCTHNQPQHPLRKALDGWRFDPERPWHAAVFHTLTAPDWLRLLVAKGMAPTMPSGIRKSSLKVRLQSLAARVNKTDLNITSLSELLEAMLSNANTNRVLSADVRRTFLKRCRRILGAPPDGNNDDDNNKAAGAPAAAAAMDTVPMDTVPMDTVPTDTVPTATDDDGVPDDEGETIHARLEFALAELRDMLDAIPPEPQPAAPGEPVPRAELDAYQPLGREGDAPHDDPCSAT